MMRKLDCYENFDRGLADRKKHPLPHGLFKLREIRRRLHLSLEEVVRIEDHVKWKTPHPELLHCTPEDKHIWLKGLPGDIAYQLGFKVMSGVNALEGDGISEAKILKMRPWVEARINQLLGDLEQSRCNIVKNIDYEYTRMRSGNGSLRALLHEAITLVEDILSFVGDPYYLQEVSEKQNY